MELYRNGDGVPATGDRFGGILADLLIVKQGDVVQFPVGDFVDLRLIQFRRFVFADLSSAGQECLDVGVQLLSAGVGVVRPAFGL